jgi:PRD1 phage membrane DNA delivery
MGKDVIEGLIAVLTAVVGLAIIAVLVGKSSSTAAVLGAGGSAFSNIIRAAEGGGAQSAGGF